MKPYPAYKPTDLDWLPQVPAHWEVKKGKRIFFRAQREVRPEDEVVTAFRDGQVTLRKNRRTSGFTESLKEIGYQGIRKGDLVIHAMDAFAGAIGVSDSDGKSTPVYAACVPLHGDNPYYFARLLRFVSHTGYLQALAKGIRERSTDFRYDNFANLRFVVPPLDEQERIVKYLGAKHREIERYIAAKRKLLLRLGELSAATISRAVTRGLNADVALQPSGVEWLGDVPKHWEVKSFRRIMRVKSGDFIDGADETDDEDSVPIYGGNGVRAKTNKFNTEGPIILLGRVGAKCGNVHLVDGKFWASEHALRVLLNSKTKREIELKYLAYLLNLVDFNRLAIRTAQPLINTTIVLNEYGCFPPLAEQTAIVNYLESQLAIIGEARGRIEREIELARELYQTLVAGVVTGQFDVSDALVVDDESPIEDELSEFDDPLSPGEDDGAQVEDDG